MLLLLLQFDVALGLWLTALGFSRPCYHAGQGYQDFGEELGLRKLPGQFQLHAGTIRVRHSRQWIN